MNQNTAGDEKGVCIVILNWRSPQETLRCIKSLKNHVRTRYSLIVIDNFSNDGSFSILEKNITSIFTDVVTVPAQKSMDFRKNAILPDCEVLLYESDCNGGYAAGNNIGIELAVKNGFNFVWILNNDTYVESDALSPMLERMAESESIGFVGSVIKKSVDEIECYGGGVYYPLLGRSRLLRKKCNEENIKNFYLMGASLLVRKQVMQSVGLMDENYFMYFEEVDWQKKASRYGSRILVADKSVVYHLSGKGQRSPMYYYYIARAGVMFSKKNYSTFPVVALLFVIFSFGLPNIKNRYVLKNIVKGALDGFSFPR